MHTSSGPATRWTVRQAPVGEPGAAGLLREYFDEVASRYYGRPVTVEEIDEAFAEDPSDHLAPPTGLFLLASHNGTTTGCVGVKVVSAEITQLTRMFVRPAARRQGGGSQLLLAAEQAARDLGARTMRLDTRHDLVEARSLYAKHGYVETAQYEDTLYTDHWLAKQLD